MFLLLSENEKYRKDRMKGGQRKKKIKTNIERDTYKQRKQGRYREKD